VRAPRAASAPLRAAALTLARALSALFRLRSHAPLVSMPALTLIAGGGTERS